MPPFLAAQASAPGKVILFGEHAVVYGIPAIAMAVSDLRVSTRVTFGGDPNVVVSLLNLTSMQDTLPLSRTWSLTSIKAAFLGVDIASPDTFLPRPSAAITAALGKFLSGQHPKDANALRPALFLVLAILPDLLDQSLGVRIQVTSGEFPLGAGLGSSAAFCVSVAAALLRSRSSDVLLSTINAHAFAAEVLLHDDPSGVDNTVSTYGGAILYEKSPQSMSFLQDLPTLRFLVTNTNVPRETKVLVANVRALHTADPAFVNARFQAIHEIVSSFQQQVGTDAATAFSPAAFQAMIARNQTLLADVGVSHPAIETVVKLAGPDLPTKLTGAGGGGCTITYIPEHTDEAVVLALKANLAKEGFTVIETVLGGHGVKVAALANVEA
ncbi:mevalonate kinase [Aphanomyces invadans]|uniref:Mevalonate kinase n=1 Tax=Aphanomyces invadans TaxID=157072 RepID=A0A024TN18_9STRA|nr:mevalonate kinase [Aphanomyces invadans]ETV95384.1 mevalonate kinase [Aphanomyces invadans]|eukprot:XP_008876085.1 mevalonate kinase [Aphanomyces invadans]